MNSPNNLEIKGNLQDNPLAELLVEMAEIKLNGSLRVSNHAQKIVIYFDAGETVFAVSNARQHRLFEMLLQTAKVTKDQLLSVPDFTSDLALKENLLKNNTLEKVEIDRLSSRQINDILQTAIDWRTGEWTFSPLVRVKGDIRYSVNLPNLLIEFARSLPGDETAPKFKNPLESLSVKSAMPAGVDLSPRESFVFSRFENAALTINEIISFSGLPEMETFQILYALWLGGFLKRQNQNAAFSERDVSTIQSTRLTVKREETKLAVEPQPVKPETPPSETETVEEAASEKEEISLEDYLERTEKAKNFYEIFALAPDSSVAEIKQTYFALAKRFHPDLFYQETDTKLLRRIQDGFSELAQAYETLKNETSREVYDFKRRKQLAEMGERFEPEATPEEINLQKQDEQAELNFKQGFDFLMNDNYEYAVPFLARAVHFVPLNARYHAYYGKALAADNKQRHKAEAEMQAAVKLDGKNADYRIMLAEFFVQVGLVKRAEGELNRLLAIFPANREAQTLLDRLRKK